MIENIQAYLVEELNLAENAEEKSAELVSRMCQLLQLSGRRIYGEKKATIGPTTC